MADHTVLEREGLYLARDSPWGLLARAVRPWSGSWFGCMSFRCARISICGCDSIEGLCTM